MPEDVKLLKIVVASPKDVQTERDFVPRVVEEVNRGVAGERGLVLKVTRWETDAFPGFHAGGPQALIDAILCIPECDIFVGIFWKHFGTPVADAKSGTDHEYKLAYETWKQKGRPQIFFYFSEKPYSPKSKEETDQMGLVLDFKKNFPKEGLWWPYPGKHQFSEILRGHLEAYLRKEFPLGAGQPYPPGTATALHQLPPPPGDFTGREAQLIELIENVEKGGVTISGLQGMGGIGKTALALKLAEQLRPRFPDAQIYLNLKGTSDKPLTAVEAMAHVIRSYRLDYKPPENQAEIAAHYHSVLDGQRAILLMDNARKAAQVLPLAPPASCLMLVTSRWHFALPGCFAKDLSVLPPEDAQKLLLAIAPRINGQADEIARVCGYLPLALRLAASALAERPDLSPAVYLYRLTNAEERVKLVDASLSLSYELLKAESQKRFRLLAVFPETFDARAAAAVWAMEPDPAQDALGELVRYSLVNWIEARQRYQLHDLVRAYAEGRLTPEERDEAERQHAAHFAEVAASANSLYLKGGDGILAGLRLFDVDWANIRNGQRWAAAHAEKDMEAARLCSRYPNAAAYCLGLRLHPRERIEWLQAGLGAARRLKDRQAQAGHLGNLGIAYKDLGETRRAIECHELALAIDQETGDRRGEGQDLGNLGNAYLQLGEPRRAIESFEQVLAILRDVSDRHGEAIGLGNLGIAYADLGEPRRAVEYYEQALAIRQEIGDRLGKGQDLGNLGNAYLQLGEPRRAIEYHEQALAIGQEIRDRRGEGQELGNLGIAYGLLGEPRRAIEYFEQVLAIMREMGDRRGEGNALGNLGIAYKNLGEPRRAIEYYEQALAIDREIGDRRGEGGDLGNLGIAYGQLGEPRRAIEYYNQQLVVTCEIGDRRGEGKAMGNMGVAYGQLGETRRAIEYYEKRLVIAREIGDRRGEGKAMGNLGLAYADLGEPRRAIEYYNQQLVITREIGDRRGEGTALFNMSLALDNLGRRADAIANADAALRIYLEIEDPNAETVRGQLAQWRGQD